MPQKQELSQVAHQEKIHSNVDSDIKIEIANICSSFYHHLKIADNNHLIFSGKYGIGKTFFLKKFFESEDNPKKYNPIFISPVNYVVSSNENIFELIKVDIIKQLYINDKAKVQSNIRVGKVYAISQYFLNHPLSLLKNLTSSLSKLSISSGVFSTVTAGVHDLIKDFTEFEKKLNDKLKSDSKKLDDFGNAQLENTGTYLEFNIISEIIHQSLQDIRKSNKENILIIDDVDRLDPEHIFRILNIFGAHNDYDSGINKFGFDKVIIVCDLNNIEEIFKHIYGEKTDFEGYIDKFYSVKPYYYDNTDAIIFYLKNKLNLNLGEDELIVLGNLLAFFVGRGELTLRRIFKINYIELTEPFEYEIAIGNNELPIYETNTLKVSTSDIPIINVLKALILVFGGKHKLSSVLKNYGTENRIKIHSKVKSAFVLSMVIPLRWMSNDNKPTIGYDYKDYRYEYPKVNAFGFECKIITNWNMANPYKGGTSIFNDCKILMEDSDKNLEYEFWFRTFHSFLDFCEKKNLIESF